MTSGLLVYLSLDYSSMYLFAIFAILFYLYKSVTIFPGWKSITDFGSLHSNTYVFVGQQTAVIFSNFIFLNAIDISLEIGLKMALRTAVTYWTLNLFEMKLNLLLMLIVIIIFWLLDNFINVHMLKK